MVTDFLQHAPYWTAVRCRLVSWQAREHELILDAIMSAWQPDCSDWDMPAGSPFAVIVAVPSERWAGSAQRVIDRWVDEGHEIEIRRTRAWEVASQVVLWGPDTSLLVTLDA